MNNLIFPLFFVALNIVFPVSAFANAAADPAQLLKLSDRSRGAAASTEGLSWSADVETFEDDSSRKATYAIKVRGNDAIAEVIAPARSKGEIMLFNDRNLWFVKPGLKKPLSISPRQKLMGQAANGDIASTNYARDYEGSVVGEETIGGAPAWKLELKAKAKNVTYDKIRYWITKKENLGVKAEFLTLGGETFKVAEFEYKNQLKVGGENFPFVSRMVITDSFNPKNKTVFLYNSPKVETHPISIFNVNNLTR